MHKILFFIVVFSLAWQTTLASTPTVNLKTPELALLSNDYGLHGKTPTLLLTLPKADTMELVLLDLLVNNQLIYERIPLAMGQNQQNSIVIPWPAPLGISTNTIQAHLYSIEDNHTIRPIFQDAELILPDQEIRYSEILTHPWITEQANLLLQSWYPDGEYAELNQYLDALVDGSVHEDALDADNDGWAASERFYRHFYRPTDQSGLQEVPGYPPAIFDCVTDLENSLIWANGSSDLNDYDWQDAMNNYANGDLWQAYYALGHVAHLLEDASVPAHTHLDIHAISLNEEPGDDYEEYCETQLESGFQLPLPSPAQGPIAFENLDQFWDNGTGVFPFNGMARLSYYRNRYPCDLNDQDDPQGILKQMYPDLNYGYDFWAFEYQWDIDTPDLGNWDYSFGSACSGDLWSGSLGDDEWWSCTANYLNPDVPGYYYVENTDYVAQIRKDSWHPEDASQDTYVSNSGGLAQNALLAADLVPLCIRYVAGLYKFFHDSVHIPLSTPHLRVTLLSVNSLQLSWDPVPGAASYRVLSSDKARGNFEADSSGTFALNSWTGPANANKFFRITAIQ